MGEIKTVVVKRDGNTEAFQASKIERAILKAMRTGSGLYKKNLATLIAEEATEKFEKKDQLETKEIGKYIQKALTEYGQVLTAQAYEKYRTLKTYRREDSEIVEKMLGIVNAKDKDAINENANKNPKAYGTIRDLVAGSSSRILAKKILPSELVLAHEEGIIHIHDLDYFTGTEDINGIHPGIINCCLANFEDILNNGTVVNNKRIEGVTGFYKAALIMTQVSLHIASSQYGGQTFSLQHLTPYVDKSRQKLRKFIKDGANNLSEEQINSLAENLLKKEISDGVKAINYQLNTFNSSNGQTPFISLFLYLNEDKERVEDTAMLIEEVFRQRMEGMVNEAGNRVVQNFPKLLYVLDENNAEKGSEYYYITELAAECISKTMSPDLISAKVMGNKYAVRSEESGELLHPGVFPCMGCRSFLPTWINPETKKPQYYGRFNKGVQSINLPDVALSAKGDRDLFWEILDERLNLIREIGEVRVKSMIKNSENLDGAPILWKGGVLSRKKEGESLKDLLFDGYSSLSLGFIGLYETCQALIGESNTSEKGQELSLKILEKLKEKTEEWNKEWNVGWSLYATPSESYCETACRKTKKRFGEVKNVTDHEFFTNSYHVYVNEEIDVFSKLDFESRFQDLCGGGAISYVEVGSGLHGNLEVVLEIMKHIYHNIQYAELNNEIDVCNSCGSRATLLQNEEDEFFCGECGSNDVEATRRICGYLGTSSKKSTFNKGKRHEMSNRVKHI